MIYYLAIVLALIYFIKICVLCIETAAVTSDSDLGAVEGYEGIKNLHQSDYISLRK